MSDVCDKTKSSYSGIFKVGEDRLDEPVRCRRMSSLIQVWVEAVRTPWLSRLRKTRSGHEPPRGTRVDTTYLRRRLLGMLVSARFER